MSQHHASWVLWLFCEDPSQWRDLTLHFAAQEACAGASLDAKTSEAMRLSEDIVQSAGQQVFPATDSGNSSLTNITVPLVSDGQVAHLSLVPAFALAGGLALTFAS
jgi:hypothetical protein